MDKVAIIILNWNGYSDTKKCLNSLIKIKNKHEIIVIDNGSSNNEAKKLSEDFGKKIQIVSLQENLGFTGGVNKGIEYAKKNYNPDFYLLLNNDVVVTKDFLVSLIKTSKSSNRIGLVSPVIYDLLNKSKILFSGGGFNWVLGKTYHKVDKPLVNNSQEFLTGCCLLIKKDVIKKVGLLDNKFFAYFEDAAYCIRVRASGYKCVCDPNSVIYHKESSSLGKKSPIYVYLFSRNRILLINKYTNIFYKLYFHIFNLLKLILVTLYFLYKRELKLRYAYFKGYMDGMQGIGGKPQL